MATSSSEDGESNRPPVANDDVLFTVQGGGLDVSAGAGILVNDDDPNRDMLTVVSFDPVSASGANVVVGNDGSVTFSALPGYWGIDTFEYTVADDEGATSSANVSVHVAPALIPLSDVANGSGGFRIDGETEGDLSGSSVAGGGDIDGDGLDDVIIGAPLSDAQGENSGRSYVVLGKEDTGAVQLSVISTGLGGLSVDGEAGGDWSGESVDFVGDVDGDGFADFVVGARSADGLASASGRAYVVLGAVSELSAVAAGAQGFVLDGEAVFDRFGRTVSGAGDVNGDGLDDVFVSAYRHNDYAGRSYVAFGKDDTDPVSSADLAAGIGGFSISGIGGEYSGRSLGRAGDVNGDGLDDVIVGAYEADLPNGENSGLSYVVFGKTDGDPVSLDQVQSGVGGFVIVGEAEGDQSGASVSGAGDVNGDGLADLIVGAPRAEFGGEEGGRAYIVFGKADGAPLPLSDVTGGIGGFLVGGEPGSRAGSAVQRAGDVNGDGLADVILSAPGSGRVYVVYGKVDTFSLQLATIEAGVEGFVLVSETGFTAGAVGAAGDVNGDGVDDVVVGASGYGDGAGRSYVIFGVRTGS